MTDKKSQTKDSKPLSSSSKNAGHVKLKELDSKLKDEMIDIVPSRDGFLLVGEVRAGENLGGAVWLGRAE